MLEPERTITFRVAWIDDSGISRVNRYVNFMGGVFFLIIIPALQKCLHSSWIYCQKWWPMDCSLFTSSIVYQQGISCAVFIWAGAVWRWAGVQLQVCSCPPFQAYPISAMSHIPCTHIIEHRRIEFKCLHLSFNRLWIALIPSLLTSSLLFVLQGQHVVHEIRRLRYNL